MSDTVVVMNDGDIQQIGTPQDIYNEPNNAFVADFIGESNIIDGIMLRGLLVWNLPATSLTAWTRALVTDEAGRCGYPPGGCKGGGAEGQGQLSPAW